MKAKTVEITLSWEQLVEEGRSAVSQLSDAQWRIGELGLIVKERYNDLNRLKQYADEIGIGIKRLRQYMNTAATFDQARRRANLSITHHEIVVSIAKSEQDKADKLLNFAEKTNISVHKFEDVVRAVRHRKDWEDVLEKIESGEPIDVKSPGDMRSGGLGITSDTTPEARIEELYTEVEKLEPLYRARLLSYLATTFWAAHFNDMDKKVRDEVVACMETAAEHIKTQLSRVPGRSKKKGGE